MIPSIEFGWKLRVVVMLEHAVNLFLRHPHDRQWRNLILGEKSCTASLDAVGRLTADQIAQDEHFIGMKNIGWVTVAGVSPVVKSLQFTRLDLIP